MAFTIAMAGKGGVGKTTLAGFMIRFLLEKDKKPILAVDADANANLNEVLGLRVENTVGAAREQMKRGVPAGMTKDVFMELKIGEALVEAEGFDLLVMGRPEGEGCYCAANTLLAGYIDKLSTNYPFIVIDNEAGMEHLSRLNARDVDLLLIVSDTSRRGIQAAFRIDELSRELNLIVRRRALILNRAKSDALDKLSEMFQGDGLKPAGTIPEDPELEEFDFRGKPSFHLPKGNACLKAAFGLFDALVN
ncbi:MAG: AAA family ATPase [Deltaproteobacteria bacterium]|nr:AAA family ATPase [Deltaproteobacteria bacterium]